MTLLKKEWVGLQFVSGTPRQSIFKYVRAHYVSVPRAEQEPMNNNRHKANFLRVVLGTSQP